MLPWTHQVSLHLADPHMVSLGPRSPVVQAAFASSFYLALSLDISRLFLIPYLQVLNFP